MLRISFLAALLSFAQLASIDAFVVAPPSSLVLSVGGGASAQQQRPSTRCKLFFTERRKEQKERGSLPKEVIQYLQSPALEFPHTFQTTTGEDTLTIRFLEQRDLSTVVPMCVREFGTSPEPRKFPWNNLNQRAIEAWLDSITFGPLVRLSLSTKILRCEQGNDESMPDIVPDYNVLCLENSAAGGVVAIVELSVQPLDPLRNPPPIPLPMFFKEAYCESKGLPAPNAWISNLLVDENARGKGYSKMLMAATEGLAKQWGCDSISLHVDSDSVAGKVPQKLYERLGYEPVVEANIEQRFDWMGPDILKTGLYMVEGVPLIFLRKQLVN
jgi:hypothetical protein